jgi:hypothetical protein
MLKNKLTGRGLLKVPHEWDSNLSCEIMLRALESVQKRTEKVYLKLKKCAKIRQRMVKVEKI